MLIGLLLLEYIIGTLTSWVFFFFQAEDGIRDYKVTGVQTCALPILYIGSQFGPGPRDGLMTGLVRRTGRSIRSEERRVGKECASRWSPFASQEKLSYRRHELE